MRGWLASCVCTWTAFAAHAHSTPAQLSLVVLLLITCVSAVVAMSLLGRKYSVWATSLVVMLSQGLYNVSLSVLNHAPGNAMGALEHAGHGPTLDLSHRIADHYANVQFESMFYAHLLAAVVSIVVLNGAERLLAVLRGVLTMRAARLILFFLRLPVPGFRALPGYFPRRFELTSAQLERLPARRGPPSFVLAA